MVSQFVRGRQRGGGRKLRKEEEKGACTYTQYEGSTQNSDVFRAVYKISSLHDISIIACGAAHSVAINKNSQVTLRSCLSMKESALCPLIDLKVFAWGDGGKGQYGRLGSKVWHLNPRALSIAR
eukprot:751688-Hanusia_phi.AAC.1